MTQNVNKANCAYFHEHDEPESSLKGKFKENWEKAIASEFKSLEENKTWIVSSLPAVKRTIKTKWIYNLKKGENNTPFRFKPRFAAKGFTQKEGIDFNGLKRIIKTYFGYCSESGFKNSSNGCIDCILIR